MMRSKAFMNLLAGVLVVVAGTSFAAAQPSTGVVERIGPNSWTNWEAGAIKAQGFGVAPRDADSAGQALLLARRAAVVDAYRNLLEASLDVAVRSRTAVEQGGVKWDSVETQVEGVVRNTAILEERQHPDGRYEVVLQMPMYGRGGLGQVVLPRVIPQRPGFTPSVLPAPTPGAYTGLIVVVRGRLDRSMSPAVLTPTGEAVYGRGWFKPGTISQELANQQGIVGYSSSPGSASRAGARPLVVYAIGTSGPPLSNFKTDVIVSSEDAARIRDANAQGRFLEQLQVDIVVQP